jgi:methylmalonyl-CoA mutase N-terminal domain/subunit
LRIDPQIERGQVARLQKLRASRSTAQVADALANVATVARSSQNLMPAIMSAVRSYATVGEISGALRKEFGEYKESVVI